MDHTSAGEMDMKKLFARSGLPALFLALVLMMGLPVNAFAEEVSLPAASEPAAEETAETVEDPESAETTETAGGTEASEGSETAGEAAGSDGGVRQRGH